MGPFLGYKATGTWVRWEFGVRSHFRFPPNSPYSSLYVAYYNSGSHSRETPILSHPFYQEWRCCVAARAGGAGALFELAQDELHVYI